MTWATVITGPDGDAPEQQRQPVGWGQGWGGGGWQLRPGGHHSLEEMGTRAQGSWTKDCRWQGREETAVKVDKDERGTHVGSEQKG